MPFKCKLIRLMPDGWNQRVFSELDFDLLCESNGVRVFDSDMPCPGRYCVYEKIPVIFLNRKLRGLRRLEVAFHEFGHHLLHYPTVQLFIGLQPKTEFEAQIVAACALIPLPLLMTKSISDIESDYGYSRKLIAFRVALYKQLSI